MAHLSPHQISFLESQNVPLSRVFDATGMTRSAYRAAMAELEMAIASGVTPCGAGRHTLRTRAGHCAQCNTHAIAFLLRHDDPGEVYVAHSRSALLVKIGTSKFAHARMSNLNSYGYGGASDWRVHFSAACSRAGRVEFSAHRKLYSHRVARTYVKTGRTVACGELFQCTLDTATQSVQAAIDEWK